MIGLRPYVDALLVSWCMSSCISKHCTDATEDPTDDRSSLLQSQARLQMNMSILNGPNINPTHGYSWNVAIVICGDEDGSMCTPAGPPTCSGTLIGGQYVLTATHCFNTEKYKYAATLWDERLSYPFSWMIEDYHFMKPKPEDQALFARFGWQSDVAVAKLKVDLERVYAKGLLSKHPWKEQLFLHGGQAPPDGTVEDSFGFGRRFSSKKEQAKFEHEVQGPDNWWMFFSGAKVQIVKKSKCDTSSTIFVKVTRPDLLCTKVAGKQKNPPRVTFGDSGGFMGQGSTSGGLLGLTGKWQQEGIAFWINDRDSNGWFNDGLTAYSSVSYYWEQICAACKQCSACQQEDAKFKQADTFLLGNGRLLESMDQNPLLESMDQNPFLLESMDQMDGRDRANPLNQATYSRVKVQKTKVPYEK